jgi:uncharacterized membrane protein
MKRLYLADWIIGVGGGLLLGMLIAASGIEIADTPWYLIAVVIFVVIVLFGALRIKNKRDFILKNTVDERLISITDKSARNGLITTYLALLGILFYKGAFDKISTLSINLVLIVIAASMFVFLVSYFFYYYQHD